jgi:hypothetical protein
MAFRVSKVSWVLLGLASVCYLLAGLEVAAGFFFVAVLFELYMYFSLLVDSQKKTHGKKSGGNDHSDRNT